MKPTANAPASPSQEKRGTLVRLLRMAVKRLRILAFLARNFCRQVRRNPALGHLHGCIQAFQRECLVFVRLLAHRADTLGGRDKICLGQTQNRRYFSTPGLTGGSFPRPPEKMTHALLSHSEAFTLSLCTVMQIAKVAHDDASERVVSASLRFLERQLWILRPYATGPRSSSVFHLASFHR